MVLRLNGNQFGPDSQKMGASARLVGLSWRFLGALHRYTDQGYHRSRPQVVKASSLFLFCAEGA